VISLWYTHLFYFFSSLCIHQIPPIKEIITNPYSLPGTPLYNRFVSKWEQVADQTVELCFHGTAEANVDAIMKGGLDPSRRNGQAYGPGEYFATHASTSLAYCKGGKKMMVFAVLTVGRQILVLLISASRCL